MSEKQNKWVEAITKLIKLTQEGNLIWSPKTGMDANREDYRVDTFFVSKYKNKILRLYKCNYRIDEPGPLSQITSIFSDTKRKYPYWTSSITLEFIDDVGNTIWTFPYSNVLKDLLEAVRYQVAGVDDFIKDILED